MGATVESLVPDANGSWTNLTNINHMQVHMYHERAVYASTFACASGISLVSSKLQNLYGVDGKVSATTEVARYLVRPYLARYFTIFLSALLFLSVFQNVPFYVLCVIKNVKYKIDNMNTQIICNKLS